MYFAYGMPLSQAICSLVSSAKRRTHTEAAVCLGDTVHLNTFYACKIAGFVKSQNKEILIIITMQMFHTLFLDLYLYFLYAVDG